MKARLLRTDLPEDVWDRLKADAEKEGMTIGVYVKHMLIKRDKRIHPVPDLAPSNREARP